MSNVQQPVPVRKSSLVPFLCVVLVLALIFGSELFKEPRYPAETDPTPQVNSDGGTLAEASRIAVREHVRAASIDSQILSNRSESGIWVVSGKGQRTTGVEFKWTCKWKYEGKWQLLEVFADGQLVAGSFN